MYLCIAYNVLCKIKYNWTDSFSISLSDSLSITIILVNNYVQNKMSVFLNHVANDVMNRDVMILSVYKHFEPVYNQK